jgi:hypothetical protein
MGWWWKTHWNKRLFDHSFQKDDTSKLLNDCWMIWIWLNSGLLLNMTGKPPANGGFLQNPNAFKISSLSRWNFLGFFQSFFPPLFVALSTVNRPQTFLVIERTKFNRVLCYCKVQQLGFWC